MSPPPNPFPPDLSPQVVCTRPLVPDVSVTSDMGSCVAALVHSDSASRRLANSPLTRFAAQSPGDEVPARRRPLKPIQCGTPDAPRLPVVRRGDQTTLSHVSRMCKLMERQDEQLQLISQQIESLLRLQQQQQEQQREKPATCNAETMTTRVWQSPVRQEGGRGILRKTVTHETSVECARLEDPEERSFYHHMLSDIDDMLSRSSDASWRSRCSPVKRGFPSRREQSARRVAQESAPDCGSETVYVKRLAAKYLREEGSPVARRKHTEQETTSLATRNYLQRYSCASSGKQVLDMSRLDRLPKFR